MKVLRNIAVSAVALISTANVIGYSSFNINNPDKVDSESSILSADPNDHEESKTDNTADVSDEKVDPASDSTDSEEPKPDKTDKPSDEKAEPTEAAASNPDLSKKYEIRTLTKLNCEDLIGFQSYVYSPTNNVIYYFDSDNKKSGSDPTYIYKYDLTTNEKSIVLDLTGESNHIEPTALTYDPYDEKVYCFSGGSIDSDGTITSSGVGFFNVESNEYRNLGAFSGDSRFNYSDYRSFYFISDSSFIIESRHTYYYDIFDNNYVESSSIPLVCSYNLSDNSTNTGYIRMPGSCGYGADIPFLHSENYYWLGSRDGKTTIIETDKLFYPSNDDNNYGKILGEYTNENWAASNLYNNEIYLMDNNFSIYKVDLDVLADKYEKKQQQPEQNNQIIKVPENDSMNELIPFINSSEIKQTGLENLTKVKYFTIIDDNTVLVFDDFDHSYKLISAK